MMLVGLKHRKTGEILAVHNLGTPYIMPPGVLARDVEIVSIVVPELPLEITEDPDHQPIECVNCSKGKALFFDVCCTEKAMGYDGKFVCNECGYIMFLKKEGT